MQFLLVVGEGPLVRWIKYYVSVWDAENWGMVHFPEPLATDVLMHLTFMEHVTEAGVGQVGAILNVHSISPAACEYNPELAFSQHSVASTTAT